MNASERSLLHTAASQFGVVSRAQALRCLSRNALLGRLHQGSWERLFPGAYRIEGSPKGWRQQLKAVCLSVGEGCALSHQTAAALLRLRGFPEGPVVLSVGRTVRLSAPVEAHRVKALTDQALTSVEGFRLTNATRTLLDLAGSQPLELLERAADDALVRRLTTVDRLAAAVARSGGRRGTAALRGLVMRYLGGDGPTESELESRVLDVIAAAGLPRPRCHQSVRAGGRTFRVDFLFTPARVILEADAYEDHASLESFERDRQRLNSLTAQGYVVLRWTSRALEERPQALLHELRAALGAKRR